MADEKKDGFDAVGFLEKYRDNSIETIPKRKKKVDAAPEVAGNIPEEEPVVEKESPQSATPKDVPTRKKSLLQDEIKLSQQEEEYVSRFIDSRLPPGFTHGLKQVPISQEFYVKINKLRAILAVPGKQRTIAGIIDNILSAHFKEYGDEISGILEK